MIYPQLVPYCTIAGGTQAIMVDVSGGFGGNPVMATTTTALTLVSPPGIPCQPGRTGVAAPQLEYAGQIIPAGTTLAFFPAFAAALVAASAANYV